VKNIFIISSLFAALVGFSACTSARWTVKDKSATDRSDYRVLKQKHFLHSSTEVTPEHPVLSMDLLTKTTYEYSERILMQRNIQDYKLRPGFVALGLGSAALAFYVANSSIVEGNATSTKSLTINAVGTLLALSGFLNMKPVGDPRPTDEEKYLRTTGHTVVVDTVETHTQQNLQASVNVRYDNRVLVQDENRAVTNGTLEIPLGNPLSNLGLNGTDPDTVHVNITFQDSSYVFNYPVSRILKPYAEVTSQITSLRNTPELTPDNILADLLQGSQIEVKREENGDWYRVLYGISENFIRKEDVRLVWRTADFSEVSEVMTVPRVPFGNIDIESNIPILRGPQSNAYALIVTNENYTGELPQRTYAHRDGRLIREYLDNALGLPPDNIYQISDFSNPVDIDQTLSQLQSVANDSSEVFIYLSGYGLVSESNNQPVLNLLGIKDNNVERRSIPLPNLFAQIKSIPSSQTLILGDLDFTKKMPDGIITELNQREIIESAARPLETRDKTISLVLGNQLLQPSTLYMTGGGEDKKHHIFPYFFARALQNRNTNLSSIYQFLERNVTYTARKLHDQPQDPLLIGNSTLDLVNE